MRTRSGSLLHCARRVTVLALLGVLFVGSARAVTYDWSDTFEISDYDMVNPSVSGVYRDLKITVTDASDMMPWAWTDTAAKTLGFDGGSWANSTPGHSLKIEKVNGSQFSLTGSLTIHHMTYRTHVSQPYETRTATIKGYVGTTATGTFTRQFTGHGSFDVDFSSLAGFTGLTSVEFHNGSGFIALGSAAIGVSNSAPTDIVLSASSISDTSATAGAPVGTLSSTDADGDETFTYALVSGAGSTDNASFTISGPTLNLGSSALAAGSYSIRIRTTDSAANTYEEVFTVTVEDNVAPTVVSVTRQSPSAQVINASSVTFRVTYSEPVNNVTIESFAVDAINGGSVTGNVTNVSGAGATRDVTVSITSGSGEFRLNVVSAISPP